MSGLDALSPLDGRYRAKVSELSDYLSEAALIRYRARVELLWLEALACSQEQLSLPLACPAADLAVVRALERELRSPSFDVEPVKAIEAKINHDVKAVEYFLAAELERRSWSKAWQAMLHFACTSEDINNVSYALMLREAVDNSLLPTIKDLLTTLASMVAATKELAMSARTHGQKASPTTLGKELSVGGYRLLKLYHQLGGLAFEAKFNGAVGNFNAHQFCLPHVDWSEFSRKFISKLRLSYNPLTTQIEPHDSIAQLCLAIVHLSTVGIDICRDLWSYVSMGYFRQLAKDQEVGSSTMPHKVNPIDFENAEGNFGVAIALAQHLASKLPISRLQRDLSDSTALRSLGSVLGHTLLSLKAMNKGLKKLQADKMALACDLSDSYEVLGEAVQSILRLNGHADAYEQIKTQTRGIALTKDSYFELLAGLNLSAEQARRLKKLEPKSYLGLAAKLAASFCDAVDVLK